MMIQGLEIAFKLGMCIAVCGTVTMGISAVLLILTEL